MSRFKECTNDLKTLLYLCSETFGSDVQIFCSEVLPRVIKASRYAEVQVQATVNYNRAAAAMNTELRNIPGIEVVHQPALRSVNPKKFEGDGIHLNGRGLGNYIIGMKKAVQHMLGLAPYTRPRLQKWNGLLQPSPVARPGAGSPHNKGWAPGTEDYVARPGLYWRLRGARPGYQ